MLFPENISLPDSSWTKLTLETPPPINTKLIVRFWHKVFGTTTTVAMIRADGTYTRNKLDFELVGTHAVHVGLVTNSPSCELEVRHAFSTASKKLVKALTGCTFTDFAALIHPTEGCIFNMMFRVAPDSFELEKLVRC